MFKTIILALVIGYVAADVSGTVSGSSSGSVNGPNASVDGGVSVSLNGSAAADSFINSINDLVANINAITTATITAKGALISSALEKIKNIKDYLGNGLTNLISDVKGQIALIGDKIKELANAAADKKAAIENEIKDKINSVRQILSNIGGSLQQAISALASLANEKNLLLQAGAKSLQGILSSLGSTINGLINSISQIEGSVTAQLGNGSVTVNATGGVDIDGNLINDLKTILDDLGNLLGSVINLGAQLELAKINFIKGVLLKIGNVFSNLLAKLPEKFNDIKAKLQNFVDTFVNLANNLKDNLDDKIQNDIDTANNFISGIKAALGDLSTGLNNLVIQLRASGEALGQKLADVFQDIQAKLNAFVNYLGSVKFVLQVSADAAVVAN